MANSADAQAFIDGLKSIPTFALGETGPFAVGDVIRFQNSIYECKKAIGDVVYDNQFPKANDIWWTCLLVNDGSFVEKVVLGNKFILANAGDIVEKDGYYFMALKNSALTREGIEGNSLEDHRAATDFLFEITKLQGVGEFVTDISFDAESSELIVTKKP